MGNVLLPETAGRFASADVALTTTTPYGRWPGYRKSNMTGALFGSPSDVGFYDGADGATCVLYRRYGRFPHLLGDACAPAGAIARPIASGLSSCRK